MRYSALRILQQGLTGNKGWKPVWRQPNIKKNYDVVIVGGGGHGLATAHYLAKVFGIRNVAVLEKGWLGSGGGGSNTGIVRSDPTLPGKLPFDEFSLKLWDRLDRDLNYNVMMSQRGLLDLCHDAAGRDALARSGNAMLMAGADAKLMDRDAVHDICPVLDMDTASFPITGGLWQPRAGIADSDAVTWGYARSADRRGVEIIQNCDVTGFRIENGVCKGVETTRGPVTADKVAVCVTESSDRVMALAGMLLPIQSHALQTFVSEPLKPLLPCVVTFGAGHLTISQSNTGGLVFGGDPDTYNSYARRSNLPAIENAAGDLMAMIPSAGRTRLQRICSGTVDISTDGAPVIDKTAVPGLYVNGGWGDAGFGATPASGYCYAHLLAKGEPHPVAVPYRLNRFQQDQPLDGKASGAPPTLQQGGTT